MKKYVLTLNEMAILSREEMPKRQIEIDLSGPEGNAFYLLGLAKKLYTQIHQDEIDEWREQVSFLQDKFGERFDIPSPVDAFLQEMSSGDYEHLLEVFDREFGHLVTLYR